VSRRLAIVLSLLATLAACTPPESTRKRGEGPGADPGNHADDLRVRERVDVDHGVPDRRAHP
jgi:hypothetical protein